MDVDDINL